jgi:hypothetical protein
LSEIEEIFDVYEKIPGPEGFPAEGTNTEPI